MKYLLLKKIKPDFQFKEFAYFNKSSYKFLLNWYGSYIQNDIKFLINENK